jgi:hypothetical protein
MSLAACSLSGFRVVLEICLVFCKDKNWGGCMVSQPARSHRVPTCAQFPHLTQQKLFTQAIEYPLFAV